MAGTISNPICMRCTNTYRTINGLACKVLRRLVEYTEQPPCDIEHFETSNQ